MVGELVGVLANANVLMALQEMHASECLVQITAVLMEGKVRTMRIYDGSCSCLLCLINFHCTKGA